MMGRVRWGTWLERLGWLAAYFTLSSRADFCGDEFLDGAHHRS